METNSITSMFILYRYDSTTGTFTVPPGGDGFYYFSVFFTLTVSERVYFNVDHNGEEISTIFSDLNRIPSGDVVL